MHIVLLFTFRAIKENYSLHKNQIIIETIYVIRFDRLLSIFFYNAPCVYVINFYRKYLRHHHEIYEGASRRQFDR